MVSVSARWRKIGGPLHWFWMQRNSWFSCLTSTSVAAGGKVHGDFAGGSNPGLPVGQVKCSNDMDYQRFAGGLSGEGTQRFVADEVRFPHGVRGRGSMVDHDNHFGSAIRLLAGEQRAQYCGSVRLVAARNRDHQPQIIRRRR